MDILIIASKTLLSMIILFILTRLMGKKQISRLTFFDYVAGITIGSITADLATTRPILPGAVSLIIWALFPVVMSLAARTGNKAKEILDGKPTVLIYEGKIIERNLKKTHMNLYELLERCRIKKAINIDEIKIAVMESNGQFSLLKKAGYVTITPKHMSMQMPYKGPCVEVVIDGEIIKKNLDRAGKDENWLNEQLVQNNISNVKTLFYAFIDSTGKLFYSERSFTPQHPDIY
jgi:uncharacterized membrane protein YcaP (DUF421 family)